MRWFPVRCDYSCIGANLDEIGGSINYTIYWEVRDNYTSPNNTLILRSSLRSSMIERTLTLATDSLTEGDAGKYICVASNPLGNCSYTIEITAQDPRSVTSGKEPIRARHLGHVTGYQPIRDQYH